MKTARQVIDTALKRIGVVAQDESATAEQYADAVAILDGLSGEIEAEAPAPWSVASGVPDFAYNALWMLLAVDLAGFYGVAQPMGRGAALARVMATVRRHYTRDKCNCGYPCKCCMGDYR